jgi:hypothetical protein
MFIRCAAFSFSLQTASKVKEFLRSLSARTYAELDKAISEAFEAVTSTDIIGWFKHCGYCIAPN